MDDENGTHLALRAIHIASITGAQPYGTLLVAFFAALATESKTFVLTAQRTAGTGNIRREAAADRPMITFVRYELG